MPWHRALRIHRVALRCTTWWTSQLSWVFKNKMRKNKIQSWGLKSILDGRGEDWSLLSHGRVYILLSRRWTMRLIAANKFWSPECLLSVVNRHRCSLSPACLRYAGSLSRRVTSKWIRTGRILLAASYPLKKCCETSICLQKLLFSFPFPFFFPFLFTKSFIYQILYLPKICVSYISSN